MTNSGSNVYTNNFFLHFLLLNSAYKSHDRDPKALLYRNNVSSETIIPTSVQ